MRLWDGTIGMRRGFKYKTNSCLTADKCFRPSNLTSKYFKLSYKNQRTNKHTLLPSPYSQEQPIESQVYRATVIPYEKRKKTIKND
jgi:hypothetical protein